MSVLIRFTRAIVAFREAYRKSIAESRKTEQITRDTDRKRTFQTGPIPVVLWLLGLLCFGFSALLWQSFGAIWGLGALGLFVSFYWAAIKVGNLRQRARQVARNAAAEAMLNQLRNGKSIPFALFLRPFSSSGKLGNVASDSKKEDLFSADLETSIAECLEPNCPLVAIGQLGSDVGSGKITATDWEWRGDFELLARHAHLMFAVLGLSAGLHWELEWLAREAMLPKCIFIIPPNRKKDQHSWHEVQEAYHTIGLRLPEADRFGRLFRIRPDGTSYGVCSLKNLSKWDLDMLLAFTSVEETLKEADCVQAEARKVFGPYLDTNKNA